MFGSNLDWDTDYYDWGFSSFSLLPPGEFWDIALQVSHGRVLPLHYHPVTRLYIVGVTGSIVK
jgi:hypothetical protein